MIFDLKKYSQKYAFEDEEGNKITYGEIEALSEKIRKKNRYSKACVHFVE